MAECEGKRVRRLVGQVDVGQLDRRVRDIGFDTISEIAGERALHTEVNAAKLCAGTQAVAGDGVRRGNRGSVELNAPARLERPATFLCDLRYALPRHGRRLLPRS